MTTDLFAATKSDIGGIYRSGDGEITFTDSDSNTVSLAAQNIQVQYQQKIQLHPVNGGKVLVEVSEPTGQAQIGALLGTGLSSFLSTYGDPNEMNDNELTIYMNNPTVTSSPTLATEVSAYQSCTFTCGSTLVTGLGAQNNVRGIIVQSSVQIFLLNVEFASS